LSLDIKEINCKQRSFDLGIEGHQCIDIQQKSLALKTPNTSKFRPQTLLKLRSKSNLASKLSSSRGTQINERKDPRGLSLSLKLEEEDPGLRTILNESKSQ